MFNLGPKKPATQKTLWLLQLLTSQYLVEGSFAVDEYRVGTMDIFDLASDGTLDEGGIEAFSHLRLTDVRLLPTGSRDFSEQTYDEWGIYRFNEVVAVIPRNALSLSAAQKAFKEYRYPLDAELYAGPYMLKGKILSDSTIPRRSPFLNSPLVPMQDVEIVSLLPGAKVASLQAAWLILNGGGLLHGYGMRQA